MSEREVPLVMAALAGVMANPVHAHKGAKAAELADLAIAAAKATVEKLVPVAEERIAPARYDVDELEELRARLGALEAKASPTAGPEA